MADQYAKSKGVLFINADNENSKAPKFKGNVIVSKEQISALLHQLKKGEEPKLQIAGWNQVSKAGKDYISLQTDIKAKLSDANDSDTIEEASESAPAANTNPFA